MKITFDISDTEANSISTEYGFDPAKSSLTQEEFVTEKFKQFGRDILVSILVRTASINEEAFVKNAIAAAKTAISF